MRFDASRVGRWWRGENEPDYGATMLMLEKCGWLNMTADAPAAAPRSDDRLEQIAAAVAQIADAQAALLELLSGTQPVRSLPQASPSRTSAASKRKRQ